VRQSIVDLAAKFRLPSVYTNREFVSAGGLASYGVDRQQLYRRPAEFVDKILKGQKPAEIPVEQPTKFELVININAEIPPTFQRAFLNRECASSNPPRSARQSLNSG
jgi:putative ABC transport system substrate-binding protein